MIPVDKDDLQGRKNACREMRREIFCESPDPSVDEEQGGFEIYHRSKCSWTWETTDYGAGGFKGTPIAVGEAEPGVPPAAPQFPAPCRELLKGM